MDVPSRKPGAARLTSPTQDAEMRVLLAGNWPALKPLPVFKCEADEYRAAMEFDKLRGDWTCRKTSFPSNKVQEMRGSLRDVAAALLSASCDVFKESASARQAAEELPKDASRRRQALLEWRETYENGVRYSGLRIYLSESQQRDAEESLRLTMTARQLQSNAKNIAYVFDALAKAGGKLATLIAAAQRNRAAQRLGEPAEAKGSAHAVGGAAQAESIEHPDAMHRDHDRRGKMRRALAIQQAVEIAANNSGAILNISETGIAVQTESLLAGGEVLAHICFQLPNAGPSIEGSAQIVWLAESSKTAGLRFVELGGEGHEKIAAWMAEEASLEVAGLTWAPVETANAGAIDKLIEEADESLLPEVYELPAAEVGYGTNSVTLPMASSPKAVPLIALSAMATAPILSANRPLSTEEINERLRQGAAARFDWQGSSGEGIARHDAAEELPSRRGALEISGFQIAAMMIFALLSLAAGLTVGRGQLGKRLRGLQKSTPTAETPAQAASAGRSNDENSSDSAAQAANVATAPEINSSAAATAGWPSERSSEAPLAAQAEDSARVGAIKVESKRGLSDGLSSEKILLPANTEAPRSVEAVASGGVASANPAPSKVAATRIALHPSSASVLISGPDDGSKPFRLTLPEKPIAASSSFAMTSQLSVLISPETAPGQERGRLQAGELVSFVWPRYPKRGERHGSAETVNVRINVGERGQVLEVNRVGGSAVFFPAAMNAIRQWRYKPTLFNNRPVRAQQDITIEFRPSQYVSHGSARQASHKGK